MFSGGAAFARRAGAGRAPRGGVLRLDARLAGLVRGESPARLMLGELLELLAERGGHHELGFSSLGAYARERCGRSPRWARESRLPAQRMARLPQLRAALSGGAIGWCMAELVARHATEETDAELTELALGSTVRGMRAHLVELNGLACADLFTSARAEPGDADVVSLGVTLGAADAWLWQWTRRFAEHAPGERTTEGFVHALLPESYSSLSHVLRLGYATESQYVRERLGISPSSFKAKVALARRCVPGRATPWARARSATSPRS